MQLVISINIFLGVLLLLLFRETRKYELLKESIKERGMMVALLSHRLRTPLTSVKWHTEMLLNGEFGKLQIAQMELLNKVNVGIQNSIEVLNTFLAAARIERGALSSRPETIDVSEQIQRAITNMHMQTEEKKLTMTLEKPSQACLIYIDPLVFHTILEVILSNAVMYTPEKGSIAIKIEREAAKITVHVTDTGIGIAQDEMENLFTKFFRSKEALKVYTNGNGLGLYLTKQMLDIIGGSIHCVSQPGKGTTFSITFPSA